MLHHTKSLRKHNSPAFHGLVSVFRSENGRKGEFLRYETPAGVPCDENGVELQVVHFKIKGVIV